jgi:hypothetical protein
VRRDGAITPSPVSEPPLFRSNMKFASIALVLFLGTTVCLATSRKTAAAFVSVPGTKKRFQDNNVARHNRLVVARRPPLFRRDAMQDNESLDDEDDDEVEPGKMRVSEIKSELELRGVDYSDCFDKESLIQKLNDARATGKADPSILNEFNKRKLEENFQGQKLEVKDEDIQKAVAGDGTLPGGLKPDDMKKLLENPEIVTLLQSTKMQDAMKLMMTGGREDLENALKDDPEMQAIVQKLNTVLRSVQ